MKWESSLEHLEEDIEHKLEKNIEENAKEQEINTRDDLYDRIETLLSSCNVLKSLHDLGEDISDALSGIKRSLEELLKIGKEKSLLSNQEQQDIIKQVQESLGIKEDKTQDNDFSR